MGETLERPQRPARHRLDVDAYYKMAEAGILNREERVELIDGEIIDMNPIGSPHAAIVKRLNRLVARAAADGIVLVSVQDPLRLDAYNEPQPDLMLLRPRADDYRASHPSAADVLLLVEISDSSLTYDRGRKLALYAQFGVPEVWIVDLAGAAVEVFRQLKEGAYSSRERRSGGALAPLLVPSVAIDVAALLA
ncbi:Uma2 family endonuclease [Methylocapsa aurea]|uniref:Uma2 family endonuclease n=1 Tax=Methylocapsa aurea TaxID=663610 RepID=UPI00055EE32E|nr:Uma2 family endonuclease [Methylocapsa aurea]